MDYKHVAGALALSVAVLASPVAQADVLYDNGPDTLVGGWAISYDFFAYDSFTLSSSATLTGVNFSDWVPAGGSAGAIYWMILDGSPGSGGHLLYGNTACQTNCSPDPGTAHTLAELSSQAGAGIDGEFDIDEEAITLPGINLADGTYWLGLGEEFPNGDGWGLSNGSSAAWVDEIGDTTAEVCSDSFGGNLASCSNSFQILGTSGAIPAPEPSSLALLGAALACFGAARRRKKRAALIPARRSRAGSVMLLGAAVSP